MYIYPSSPESEVTLQSEESAAIKIQAGFRGYRVRKQLYRLSKSNSSRTNGHLSQRYANQHSSSARRQQRQQHPHINDFMDENRKQLPKTADGQPAPVMTDVSSVENRSATKIQAGFRGFLVRKKQKIATDAAVKIQSSFREFKARKDAEKFKQP
ncbi:abnormal spindle-like microcephaly-associated protein homolog [Drosophila montana]|uniref:abnormal spindle-like microcephaly-associated protein homolog n=1 Tax=Drosophila montana TaxID=40370 RepID=UPI00313EFB31